MRCGSGRDTYRERPRGVARRRPAPSPVQAEALVLNDLEHTAAAEGLGVGLALDLEHVEREEDDLADADKTARSRVHDGLARLLAEGALKVLAVVGVEVVARHGLATVLVHALQHLVASGVPEAGEQRDELPPDRRASLVLEDDGVELRRVGDLDPGASQSLDHPFEVVVLEEEGESSAPCPRCSSGASQWYRPVRHLVSPGAHCRSAIASLRSSGVAVAEGTHGMEDSQLGNTGGAYKHTKSQQPRH